MRNTGNKYHWHVWGVLTVPGPHWVCLPLTACVPFQSTLLRLQVAPKRNCPKWPLCCMHFPGLSCSGSGSQTFHKGTDLVGPAFCALPRSKELRQPGAWLAHYPSVQCILPPPWSQLPGFLVAPQEHCLRCVVCLLWRANLRLQPSWQMSTIQDPRKTWLATGSLLTVW